MKRLIVILETKAGVVYEIEKESDGRIIKSIVFNQNGLASINQGGGSAYLVLLQNPLTDKDQICRVVPYEEMREVVFIAADDSSTESNETATKMTVK